MVEGVVCVECMYMFACVGFPNVFVLSGSFFLLHKFFWKISPKKGKRFQRIKNPYITQNGSKINVRTIIYIVKSKKKKGINRAGKYNCQSLGLNEEKIVY